MAFLKNHCLFILLLQFAMVTGCTFSPLASQKIVLDVNGARMKAGEFAQELAFRLRDQDALSAKDPKVLAHVKSRIEQEFIVHSLSEQWAQQNGVLVKAEELEAEIQKLKSNYPDDLAFQQALASEGISFKDWRAKIQDTLLQKHVVEKLSSAAVPPSDQEIKDYFESHRSEFVVREGAKVRQILLSSEGDANMIMAELKKGKRLSDLAQKYSVSPEGQLGGDIGWVEKGQGHMFDAALKMRIGQRSDVIKSSYGYHIFEVTAHRAARLLGLNEAKDQIRTILVAKRHQDLYFSWLDEQTRKARIFKDSDLIDSLKVETKLK